MRTWIIGILCALASTGAIAEEDERGIFSRERTHACKVSGVERLEDALFAVKLRCRYSDDWRYAEEGVQWPTEVWAYATIGDDVECKTTREYVGKDFFFTWHTTRSCTLLKKQPVVEATATK